MNSRDMGIIAKEVSNFHRKPGDYEVESLTVQVSNKNTGDCRYFRVHNNGDSFAPWMVAEKYTKDDDVLEFFTFREVMEYFKQIRKE